MTLDELSVRVQIQALQKNYKQNIDFLVQMTVLVDPNLHKWRYNAVLDNLNYIIHELHSLQGKLP